MKAKILAGAIAALMYGTGAVAEEAEGQKECPPGQTAVHKNKTHKSSSAKASPGTVQEEDLVIEEVPVDNSQGTGGSGDGSSSSSQKMGSSDQGLSSPSGATGGSGAVYMNMPVRCEPVDQSGMGGSGGSGITPPPPAATPPPPAATPPAPPPPPPANGGMSQSDSGLSGTSSSADATGGSGLSTPPPSSDYRPSASSNEDIQPLEVENKKNKNVKKGLTVLIGGGVEGYTGALAPQLSPGPTAGVTASLKPTSVLGVEVGYTGALNNIRHAGDAGASSGPDLVRNGGQAALTLAVAPTAIQPYLMGGIGISNYHFRGGESLGYKDDTVGNVPAGVGLRSHIGHFTADLRGYYNFLFDKDFAPDIKSNGNPSGGGSYTTSLNVGGTF